MKQLTLILVCAASLFISCKKEYHIHPGGLNPEKLLVSNVWQVQKLTSSQGNTLWHYVRGGQDNNFNYDGDYLDFEADGTGTYSAGALYDITWEFTNADKSELTYVIRNYANGQPADGIDLTVKMENVHLAPDSFKYAEIYTNENGVSAVSSVYRTPYINKTK